MGFSTPSMLSLSGESELVRGEDDDDGMARSTAVSQQ